MENLIEEFNNMKSMPMFEIEVDEEYYIYHIAATSKGLEAGGVTNTGFHSYGLICEWDEYYDNLDYYLEGLYEICLENAMEENNDNS